MPIIIIIIFFLGLAVGSFINALVYRLHTQKSWIKTRSICPRCQHQLAWHDLIPVLSFFVLRGKCRYCQQKISIQYPLVELSTGILFTLVYVSMFGLKSFDQLLIFNLFILTILILIFVYDLKYYLIPDQVIIPAIVVVFVVNLVLGKSLSNLLLAAIVSTVFFLAQFLISKGQWLGGGDLRLGFFMGVVLGWPLVLVALFLAYILGSAIGLLLVLFKIKKWRSKIPFAAFLAPATLVTLLWGEKLLNWYLKLF